MSLEQSLEKLAAALDKLADAVANGGVTEGAAPKATRAPRTKPAAEPAPTPVVDTPVALALVDEFSGDAPTATTTTTTTTVVVEVPTELGDRPETALFDYEVLKASILTLAAKGKEGKEKAIALIGEYGHKSAKDLDPQDWAALHAKIVAASK